MSKDRTDNYTVPGFLANGIHVGIKEGAKKDLALVFSTVPAVAAGVFTTNCFKAAPVLLDMERIRSGSAQAIITNSGNANAATGEEGYRDALRMSRAASEKLKIPDDRVLVASTGVIGHRLPVEKIEAGMDQLVSGLDEKGIPAAEEAIMTTDRFPKISCRRVGVGPKEITLCGMAKGAGMIEPQMATMLAYVMTDAAVERPVLDLVFRRAVERSFNAVSVDGCMSTNDTAIILANGLAGNRIIRSRSRALGLFEDALSQVLLDLAVAMVRDGEGATKVIEIIVEEARSVPEAKKIAYAVAHSSLVKTAFFGGDPNWGRIISAAGSTGIALPVEAVKLYFEDVPVFSGGCGLAGQEGRTAEIMRQDHIKLTLRLAMGNRSWRIFASDLTYEYVKINAHYHT